MQQQACMPVLVLVLVVCCNQQLAMVSAESLTSCEQDISKWVCLMRSMTSFSHRLSIELL
jgi:hypothetical protein